MSAASLAPQRIVCLTEETTEWLYLPGQEARTMGISGHTVRPRRAREKKPKVSAFLNAKIDTMLALQPGIAAQLAAIVQRWSEQHG